MGRKTFRCDSRQVEELAEGDAWIFFEETKMKRPFIYVFDR